MAHGHSLPGIAECETCWTDILFLCLVFKKQTNIFFYFYDFKIRDHLIKTTHNELTSSTAVVQIRHDLFYHCLW